MKKTWKMLAFMLVIVFAVQMTVPAFAAEQASQKVTVLCEEIDRAAGTALQIAEYDNLDFFSYVDDKISYCAQINNDNQIQFSYVLTGADKICESDLFDVGEICDTYGLAPKELDYKLLNHTIIENIADFELNSVFTIPKQSMAKGFSDLEDAIEDAFGTNYVGEELDHSWEYYNGTYYFVRCTESQTTSHTTPDSMWFAKDTAITTIIAWLLTGGWGWLSLGVSLVASVVATTIRNGVRQTINNFTAERSDVSLMLTRIVTVNGYTGTQYWAGWTRKMYFLKGDLGWTHDVGFHYNVKHSDFDDVTFLLQRGFDNFVNFTLQGGY